MFPLNAHPIIHWLRHPLRFKPRYHSDKFFIFLHVFDQEVHFNVIIYSIIILPWCRFHTVETYTTLQIFHPNVHFRSGDVCLDILKKEWSPAWGLQAACRAVLALLSDPDADSPLNCDAGNMIRGNDMVAYNTTAKMYTIENAQFIKWPGET